MRKKHGLGALLAVVLAAAGVALAFAVASGGAIVGSTTTAVYKPRVETTTGAATTTTTTAATTTTTAAATSTTAPATTTTAPSTTAPTTTAATTTTAPTTTAATTTTAPATTTTPPGVQVIRLFALTVQSTTLDLGTSGPSLGDETVFSDDLSPAKGQTKTGFDGGVCTIVRLDQASQSATAQCVATFSLSGGQIAVQGLASFTAQGTSTATLPITGGTGSYRDASGQATVEILNETEANITLEVNTRG